MLKRYHRLITERALATVFGPQALEEIIAANLHQDHLLTGQIGHPEFHFDENAFAASLAYIETQRGRVGEALSAGRPRPARRAFGRLIHAAQDFYAHSNYVRLWLARHPASRPPSAERIEPCDPNLLTSPELRSGRLYYPLEVLSFIPFSRAWAMARLPRDSHAWMNLDTPECGTLFDYAVEAAVKRTRLEYERTVDGLSPEEMHLFVHSLTP